jgi:hypothetical protein
MNRFAKLASIVLPAALLLAPATGHADEKAGDGASHAPRTSSAKKTMNVKRLVTARGIDGHEPQDVATSFAAREDRIYAFVEVENPGSDDAISVVFQPPSGPAFAEIPLKIGAGAAHFRTWAFTRRAHEVGEWAVVVRDTHGKVLGRQSFTITK